MAANLKTTRYLNSDLIGTTALATKDISVENEPKYQWAYAGDESNVSTFGRLYTWHAITDSRKVCLTGWHVPTDSEWTTLTTYLGGESVTGGKLKETGTFHWSSPNSGATNDSVFTALTRSTETCMLLSRWWIVFGISAEFWMHLLVEYNISLLRTKLNPAA